MQLILGALRAAGESTRMRLLALLARNELTVTEITRILGQSQPRVSRHLKLLAEAQLVERHQEGAWVFYRLCDDGPAATVAQSLIGLIPADDPTLARDRERLESIRSEHVEAAAAYFRENARHWDRIRRLHVTESKVERAMLDAAGHLEIRNMLDLGTGTGRMLELFGPRVGRGLGIDLSREMLAVARARLEERELRHCQVRLGDIFHLTLNAASMDLVTIHQVLHYLDAPAEAVTEAARMLCPGGRLLVVDFAPHQLEFLRTDYAHRRLGFSDVEVLHWMRAAGLARGAVRQLKARPRSNTPALTVSVWHADRPLH